MPPRAVLSWSSGKDCAHALHVCRTQGLVQIDALMTTLNEEFNRVAMHGTRHSLLHAQARAVGLPLIEVPLPWPCSNEDYEARMASATAKIAAQGITHIVFGDLFLEDVRDYRIEKLKGSGLTPLFPLFGSNTTTVAQEMIASGVSARIVTCDPTKLDQSFAGRVFDQTFLDDLPEGIDPCGENGEFHSAVTHSPEFSAPIDHKVGETVLRDGFVYADVIPQD